MKQVNVAVVGLGFMGVTHLKAYRQIPGARIAAICDAVRLPVDGDFSSIGGNVGNADPFKLDMAQVKATQSLDELLSDPDIDLIDLCVPTIAHPKLAVAALQSGKHVICEKPLARTSALSREIVAAAEAAKGFFMPAMCIRFWPEYAWLKQTIAGGAHGRVLAARFRRVAEMPGWSPHFVDGTKSGGALLDLHIHDADFIQYCFGKPKAVHAAGFTRYTGAIDHVVAQYTVEGGACVTGEGSWAMTPGFGFNMSYTVIFENATVDFDIARGTDALKRFVKGQPGETITPAAGDGYLLELTHLVESILAHRAPTVVTPRDGLGAVEICEAAEQSIQTGQTVAIPS